MSNFHQIRRHSITDALTLATHIFIWLAMLNKIYGKFNPKATNFCFRVAIQTVKKERTKPSVALANLQDRLQEKHTENNTLALLLLPRRKAMLQTFSRKRRLTAISNFDPLMPPENLYVIFNSKGL